MTVESVEPAGGAGDLLAAIREAQSKPRPLPMPVGTLTELALLPQWTPGRVREIGILSENTMKKVRYLEDRALVECRPGFEDPENAVYWIRNQARTMIGERAQLDFSPSGLLKLVSGLRGRVAGDKPWFSEPAIREWSKAVDLFLSDPTGGSLLRAVEKIDLTEANRLIETAAAIADIVGGRMSDAIERGRAIVATRYRKSSDERFLKRHRYMPRDDVEGPISNFLSQSDSTTWALHLHGDGGVGKTMTIRNLSTGQLPSSLETSSRDIAAYVTATVDFDHIDPRFPFEKRLLLLEALAVQLAFPPDSTARMNELRQRLADESTSAAELAPVAANKANEHITAGIAAFADLVALVGRMVVLILDTTEELAKVHDPGKRAPAVTATLDLMSRVYAQVLARNAALRVIFAGRRSLIATDDGGAGEQVDIEVVRVEGFRADEAERFVRERVPGTSNEDRALLLQRANPAKDDAGEPRYNPYELSNWVEWMLAEARSGGIDFESIPATADPYVERRILARITEREVRALLAPAVTLGRFDVAILGPTMKRERLDPVVAIELLSRQEWIEVVERSVDGPRIIEVDQHLATRLRAAVTSQSNNFPLDRARLCSDVTAAIFETPIVGQERGMFAAAIRLLAPDESVDFWTRLERKVARERAWNVFTEILPEIVAAATAESVDLLPYIHATQAAVAAQRGEPAEGFWRQVIDSGVPFVRSRARLALADKGGDPSESDVADAPIGSVAGSINAMLDADRSLFEEAESTEWFRAANRRLITSEDMAARAIGCLALLRAGAAPPSAVQSVGFALTAGAQRRVDAADDNDTVFTPEDWVDFTPPAGLASRCYLDWLLATPSHSLATVRRIVSATLVREVIVTPEGAVLAAAAIDRWLAIEPVPPRVLEDLDELEADAYGSTPLRRARFLTTTPRLVDVIARGYAALGRPDSAELTLRNRLEQATAAGNVPKDIVATKLALLWLYRRYRVPSASWSLDLGGVDSASVAQARLLVDRAPSRLGTSATFPERTARDAFESMEVQLLVDRAKASGQPTERRRAAIGPVETDMAAILEILACARDRLPVSDTLRDWSPSSRFFSNIADSRDIWHRGWAARLDAAYRYLRGDCDALIAALNIGSPTELLPSESVPSGRSGGQRQPDSMTVPEVRRRWHPVTYPLQPRSLVLAIIVALVYGGLAFAVASLAEWSFLTIVTVAVAVFLAISLTITWPTRRGVGFVLLSRVSLDITTAGDDKAVVLAAGVPTSQGLDRVSKFQELIGPPSTGRVVKRGFRAEIALKGPGAGRFDTRSWRRPLVSFIAPHMLIAELHVAPELEHLPWEGWIRASTQNLRIPITWIRAGGNWPATVPAVAQKVGYAGPRHIANNRVQILDLDSLQLGVRRTTHVIGMPVRTAAGWRFRPDLPTTKLRPRSSGFRRAGLVAPTQISQNGGVVILQASTIDQGAKVFGDLRPGWLDLARNIVSAGAAGVVLVPPLSDEAAAKAVDISTSWVGNRKGPLVPSDVLVLTGELRRLVAGESSVKFPRFGPQDNVVAVLRMLVGAPADTRRLQLTAGPSGG